MNPKTFLALIAATCSTVAQPTSIFSENFDSPSSAARFQYDSGVSFANDVLTVPNGSVATLRPGNLLDDGAPLVTYSLTQTTANSTTMGKIRLRGSSDSPYDGYYFVAGNGYVEISRITDEERAIGILGTAQGGTIYTPPVLSTPGPYKLDLALENRADMVRIQIFVDGSEAMVFEDDSPYRITQGDTLAFSIGWGEAASWDNVTVTSVPEPSTLALAIFAFATLCSLQASRNHIKLT